MKYTFKFPPEEEGKFRRIVDRLDEDEYTVIEEIAPVDLKEQKSCDRQTVMDMDPDAALTFRLGMKHVNIRRERTEEELAEEQRINDQHTVKITVRVDGMNADGSLADPNVLSQKLDGIELK